MRRAFEASTEHLPSTRLYRPFGWFENRKDSGRGCAAFLAMGRTAERLYRSQYFHSVESPVCFMAVECKGLSQDDVKGALEKH